MAPMWRLFLYMAEIRKYKDSDLTCIFEIYRESRQSEYFAGSTAGSIDDFLLQIEDEEIYLAFVEEKPAGFVSVYPSQSFVHHLYVHSEYRNQGIGRLLIDFARNKFELPLSLKCETVNKPAIAFYKNTGWKIFKKGSENDGTEYILMTLDLD